MELESLRVELKDAEVKRAYEAKLAALRKERAEAEALAAAERAAAEKAVADKAAADRRAADQRAAEQAVAIPTPAAPRGSGLTPSGAAAAAPDLAPPPPSPPPPRVYGGSAWLCPVAGSNAFGDTWGAARSGGRRHEGVDMMSPSGTPLVAVVAGNVQMKTNKLGGNVVWLNGADGARYYYAHLSAWEGGSRSVQAGEVIGYVGQTGNTSANHLHFEIHPGGGAAVNPYPTVRNYC